MIRSQDAERLENECYHYRLEIETPCTTLPLEGEQYKEVFNKLIRFLEDMGRDISVIRPVNILLDVYYVDNQGLGPLRL